VCFSGFAFLTVVAEKHVHRLKLQEFFPGSRIIRHHTMKQYGGLGVESKCMLDLSNRQRYLSLKKDLQPYIVENHSG
jgi:hypothetical protein